MQANWFLTSRSLALSIILHVILGGVLLFSFHFSAKPTPPPKPVVNIVNAVSVDRKQVELELNRLKEQDNKKVADEIKRQKELEKKAEDAKKKRVEEEKKLADVKKKKEQEIKKRKQEEARIKNLEKEKKELEKKTMLEQEKKKKAEIERKKIEAEKKKQEAELKEKEEQKRKAEEEKKRLDREKALQDQLNAELAAEQDSRDQSTLAKYISLIQNDIQSNFNQLGLPEGLSCVILIRMLEGGKVVEASIIKSSGNDLFDRRAETAVYSASPLPVPDEIRLFEKMRNIRFTFEP
jgi:colicin import membrane protein